MAEDRRLRYSERKRVAERGSLGDFVHDDIPQSLRHAVAHAVKTRPNTTHVAPEFRRALHNECAEFFGWPPAMNPEALILHEARVDVFLDFVEILVQEGERTRSYRSDRMRFQAAIPKIEDELNHLFDRHRFGYRVVAGEAQRIGSPALSDVVIGPALLASQRPGWEEVEKRFREALLHQRGGPDERDDALTAAASAIEAALIAAGYGGTHLPELARSFKASPGAFPQLAGVPELLDPLLKRPGALRNQHSDSHGRAPGAQEIPQALADLAIHWAGAFIVYLAATTT